VKVVLDTNIYIHALRDADARRELAAWQRRMAPFIYLHAVVMAELLVGSRDEAVLARWRQAWVEPAERVGRIITPRAGTWERAARLVVRLVRKTRVSPGALPPGFLNDCLLAASAREEGLTIVTHNAADFARIREADPAVRYLTRLP
jgi:predicted nucleic acid-binding protein